MHYVQVGCKLCAIAPLTPEKEASVPTAWGTGWSPETAGRCAANTNLLSLPEIEPGFPRSSNPYFTENKIPGLLNYIVFKYIHSNVSIALVYQRRCQNLVIYR